MEASEGTRKLEAKGQKRRSWGGRVNPWTRLVKRRLVFWNDRIGQEEKPCTPSSYTDALKQSQFCPQSFIILLQSTAHFEGWHHETALWCCARTTVPPQFSLFIKQPSYSPECATHTVIAELTQVISSNEEGHQLPVILEIYRLKGCKESRWWH